MVIFRKNNANTGFSSSNMNRTFGVASPSPAFYAFDGRQAISGANETSFSILFGDSVSVFHYCMFVNTNSGDFEILCDLRIDVGGGASGTLTVGIGLTGAFRDITNRDPLPFGIDGRVNGRMTLVGGVPAGSANIISSGIEYSK